MAKRIILLLLFSLASLLLFPQMPEPTDTAVADTAISSEGLNLEFIDWIDLLIMVVTYLVGFASGAWSRILQIAASLLPFLRDYVDDRERKKLTETLIARSARLEKIGVPKNFKVDYRPPGNTKWQSIL